MKAVKKIDAHHHLWDLSKKKNIWLLSGTNSDFIGDHAKLNSNYNVEDYLLDIKNDNIVKSVHIQAGWDSSDPVGETEWLQSIADKYGFPHGIVGYVDLTTIDAETILEKHSQFSNVREIRQILNWDDNPYYSGCDKNYIELKKWQENFSLLAKYNLSFDMQIHFTQMLAAKKVAQRNPDITIVLDHAGMPLFRGENDFAMWKKQLKVMAELPNVVVKLSGLGMFNHSWTTESIRPIVLTVIDLFGVDKCMFASNFPIDKLYSDYDTLLSVYYTILNGFSLDEQEEFFYENALRIYRL